MNQPQLLNNKIPYSISMPANGDGKPVPVAILCCGTASGSMFCVGDYYKQLGEELNKKGIAAICFDFAGNGSRANEVVHDDVADLEQIFEYIKSNDSLNENALLVHGYSFSTLSCTKFVANHPDSVIGYSVQAPCWAASAAMEDIINGVPQPNFNFMENGEVKVFYHVGPDYGATVEKWVYPGAVDGPIANIAQELKEKYHGSLTFYVGEHDAYCADQVNDIESYFGVKCNMMPGGHTMGLYDNLKEPINPAEVMKQYCDGLVDFAENAVKSTVLSKEKDAGQDIASDNAEQDRGL